MSSAQDLVKRFLAEDLLVLTATSKIESVEDLRQRATDFLRLMGNGEEKDSLAWFAIQQQNLLSEELNIPEENVERVLQYVREQRPQRDAEEAELQETSPKPKVKSELYGPGRRRIPMPTEANVDLAVEQLSPQDWNIFKAEIDAEHDVGFDLVDSMPLRSSPQNDLGQLPGADEDTRMRPDVPDGGSRYFGSGALQIVYDPRVWPSDQFEEEPPAESANDCSGKPGQAPVVGESSTGARQDDPTMHPEQFIRDRVRAMLLANRVVDDLEDGIVRAVLSTANELRRDEDQKIRELMKSQLNAICEAVALLEKLRETDRIAMSLYIDDPYRKQPWQRDEAASGCHKCGRPFTILVRHHHCRRCGLIFCHGCSSYVGRLPKRDTHALSSPQWSRLCVECYEQCCEHQRAAEGRTMAPPSNCERDTRAPENLSHTVLRSCPNSDKTLEDKLPPFYVILPEEWYAMKQVSASRCLSSAFSMPHFIMEGIQDGASAFLSAAVPKVFEWATGAVTTVRQVQK